jgi:hypothetical protein
MVYLCVVDGEVLHHYTREVAISTKGTEPSLYPTYPLFQIPEPHPMVQVVPEIMSHVLSTAPCRTCPQPHQISLLLSLGVSLDSTSESRLFRYTGASHGIHLILTGYDPVTTTSTPRNTP